MQAAISDVFVWDAAALWYVTDASFDGDDGRQYENVTYASDVTSDYDYGSGTVGDLYDDDDSTNYTARMTTAGAL